MKLKEIIAILMESPFYLRMKLEERQQLVREFSSRYPARVEKGRPKKD